jgi:hypothetical protein
MMNRKRALRVGATASATIVASATVCVATTATRADAVSGDWLLIFLRNNSDRTDGRLYKTQGLTVYDAWRAGTSMGKQYNECQPDYGPTPAGNYALSNSSWNPNWPGTSVRGPVIQLPDHKCYDGTPRTQLFIHSTYPWDPSHYHSQGCVKLSNTGGPSPATGDIKDMYDSTYHLPDTLTVDDGPW